MYTYDFNKWNGQRLDHTSSLNVVIDLVPCRRSGDIQEWLSEKIIHQTARRLRNKINQNVFGNAAKRYGKQLIIIISLHKTPHQHLHCLIEIPDRILPLKLQSIISRICLQDKWLKMPNYVRETANPIGSQIYNGSNGSDTVLIF